MNDHSKKREKNTLKDYFAVGEVLGYFFRKKDPNRKTNFNLRMMHGINKISILIFLLALVVIVIKRVFLY
ncbi:MAG: DUF6728 family protein [Bacteroidota bacterium]